MIYIKQYNSLFDSPEVHKPVNIHHEHWQKSYEQDLAAYNKWRSSKIEVIGDHTWQDLQEVIEGVDYRICYLVKRYMSEPFFYTAKDTWEMYSENSRKIEAIPITPKP